ncbi:tRNA (adenosine(37)-N6)-threonylcarbamoyltransferase complex dimerization subunit type 1 TsaB [Bounagaea algeriensis]
MLVIALDTATPAVTAGLVELGDAPRRLAARITTNPRAHGELLVPHLADAAAEAGCELSAADAVVVGSGPGPFTGLRVGMATAAALGTALELPVHPVCSLDAIARSASGACLVATDARRKEVYWAAYDDAHTRVDGPHVQRPADVPVTECAGAEHAVAEVLGEKAAALEVPEGVRCLEGVGPAPEGLVAATAEALRSGAEPDPLVPLYLRRPDAAEPGPRKRVTPARGDR